MKYVTITRAGLMDPSIVLYTPALKIDYNVHTLENLHIVDNLADGLQIMHNDVYANTRLVHSTVERNFGNGVTVRGSFFEIYNCILRDNGKAGFEYNPAYTTYEALQIRAGIHDFLMFDKSFYMKIEDYQVKWFITPQKYEPESTTYDLEIEVNQQYRVCCHLLFVD